MTMFSRRSVSKTLAGGLAAASLSVKAPAVWAQSNMPKVKAAFPPVLDAAIFHVGKAKGMYAAERIEVEFEFPAQAASQRCQPWPQTNFRSVSRRLRP